MINSIESDQYGSCCGCFACLEACPQQAIRKIHDELGFLYPRIDNDLCINCGICEQVCSFRNKSEEHIPLAAYGAVAKDVGLLGASASGGFFGTAASSVLARGGVVFGAALAMKDNVPAARMIRIDDPGNIKLLQDSKYVQCDTAGTYQEAKQFLKAGREVLYSGTPCQIAGLYAYLGDSYENLYTIDLICHAVGSPKLLSEYLARLARHYEAEVVEFRFRSKKAASGPLTAIAVLRDANGETYKKEIPNTESSYYTLFLKSETVRESCFSCKYANRHRPADLTIGDFWGVENTEPDFLTDFGEKVSSQKGISCVIVNTEHGGHFFDSICGQFYYVPTTFEKIASRQKYLNHPSEVGIHRAECVSAYHRDGYEGLERLFRQYYQKSE